MRRRRVPPGVRRARFRSRRVSAGVSWRRLRSSARENPRRYAANASATSGGRSCSMPVPVVDTTTSGHRVAAYVPSRSSASNSSISLLSAGSPALLSDASRNARIVRRAASGSVPSNGPVGLVWPSRLTASGHSGCRAAQTAATIPPSECPTMAGVLQPVWAITAVRSSIAPSQDHKPGPERPCPRRSAVTTRSPASRQPGRHLPPVVHGPATAVQQHDRPAISAVVAYGDVDAVGRDGGLGNGRCHGGSFISDIRATMKSQVT